MKNDYFEIMRNNIRNEFIELYGMKNLSELSVKDITRRVNISRTTFYNYYDDLYEVLEDIEDRLINSLKTINVPFENYNFKKCNNITFDYFYETLNFIKNNSKTVKVLMNKDSQFIYKWKKIIKDDFRKKYDRENIQFKNKELVLEMIASAVLGAYSYWLFHIDEISIEDISNDVLYKLCQDLI